MIRGFTLFFLIFFAAIAWATTENVDFGRYRALVIGNNNYEHLPNLQTAIADARAVAKILESKYRFKVDLVYDARRQTIIDRFNQLTSQLTERDNLLIYYAGHGTLDEYGTLMRGRKGCPLPAPRQFPAASMRQPAS